MSSYNNNVLKYNFYLGNLLQELPDMIFCFILFFIVNIADVDWSH